MSDSTSPAERWAWVVGYEGLYEVSTLGRVRSHHGPSPRILKPSVSRLRRRSVGLRGKGTKRGHRIHVLVLEAFVGPRPPGAVACHNNGDSMDDRLENLRWDTWSSNHKDTVRHGRHNHANTTHCPRGHRLEPPNLQKAQWAQGKRSCLACHRATSNFRSAVRRGIAADIQVLADAHYQRIMNGDPNGSQ